MMNSLIKMKSKKGFTLVELIVVIAILGVIAAIATPSLMTYVSSSKVDADKSSALALENAIKRAIAKGNITIDAATGDITTAEEAIQTAIQAEFPTIPVPQQDDTWFYYVNNDTYIVAAKPATGDGAAVSGTDLKIN